MLKLKLVELLTHPPFKVCTHQIGETSSSTISLFNNESYRKKNPSIHLMSFGEKVELKSNQLELDYEVFLTLVPMENNTSKNFFLEVTMKHKLTKRFLQIIAPPILLVVVSWVRYVYLNKEIILTIYSLVFQTYR